MHTGTHKKDALSFFTLGVSALATMQLLTSDMYANAHTLQCARLAAGGAVEVACRVARGEAAHGAAIVRPPGTCVRVGVCVCVCVCACVCALSEEDCVELR